MTDWQWFGQAGHFICAARCRFHLHTHVGGGKWCVSTVGEYFSAGHLAKEGSKPEAIGGAGPSDGRGGRTYETMVFELDAGGECVNWSGCDSDAYWDRDSAQAGHVAMCRRWDGPTA